MKRAIFSTLRHCKSSDVKPQHSTCPTGENSWCFYNRAIARKQPVPSHKRMSSYLREDVVCKMVLVYKKLVSDEVLQKCKGETQNANECLHSVIWNSLPKTEFFTLQRMIAGIYRSVKLSTWGYQQLIVH